MNIFTHLNHPNLQFQDSGSEKLTGVANIFMSKDKLLVSLQNRTVP